MEGMSLISEALRQVAVILAPGMSMIGQEAVQDAYTALRAAIQARFGEAHDLPKAVEQLEKKPDSAARRAVVDEEIQMARAEEIPELRDLARALLETLQATSTTSGSMQTAQGSQIAQAMGPGSSAKVHVRR